MTKDKKEFVEIASVFLLASLVGNPERYKYIAGKIEAGELTNETATAKNVNKSLVMAESLYDEIKKRYGS